MKHISLKSIPNLLLVLLITAASYHLVHWISGTDMNIYTRGLVISEIIAISSFLSQKEMTYRQSVPIAIISGAFTALLNTHLIPPPQS